MAQRARPTLVVAALVVFSALVMLGSAQQQPATSQQPAGTQKPAPASQQLPQETDLPVAAIGPSRSGPPTSPIVVELENRQKLRVTPIAHGLTHPWGMTFLPDGKTLLVTERAGRLRVIRNGVLDPTPVSGIPQLNNAYIGGLQDVAVHPQFATNRFIYISYAKEGDKGFTLALARGKFDGKAITDLADIFVADAWEGQSSTAGGTYGGRMLFGPDGLLYMTVGDRDTRVMGNDPTVRLRAQQLNDHGGKVLRLKDDGSVPEKNPFVGRANAKPEIYTYGHRNAYGLAFHPQSGQLWACEFGPMGGDELNILLPGNNYGWPLVSVGRNYTGEPVSEQSWWRAGMEMPAYVWNPTVNPSSIIFYKSRAFAGWNGSLIVSGLGSKQLQRLTINRRGQVVGRPQVMLEQLGLRFRVVIEGPEGELYVATEGRVAGNDDTDGSVLRIDPVPEA
jgi:glucose/arabinose dehydrogenase